MQSFMKPLPEPLEGHQIKISEMRVRRNKSVVVDHGGDKSGFNALMRGSEVGFVSVFLGPAVCVRRPELAEWGWQELLWAKTRARS